MLSEHQSIDEFFRQKEEDSVPDNSREDAHWQQMKTMLAAPGHVRPTPKRHIHVSRRIISYAGGFAIITIVTIVTIAVFTLARHKKTTPATDISLHKNNPAPHRSPLTAPTAIAHHTAPATNHPKSLAKKTRPRYTSSHIAAHHAPIVQEDTGSRITAAASQPDAAALLQNFYSQLEPQKQEFFIQNNLDTTLLAKEGTRFIIPAGAFVDKAGNDPRGTVKILLTEFYNYNKMVAAGLGTSSNGQQLVSGGMLYISAWANGQELQIRPSVNVTIKMPTNSYDGRMQLFTGINPEQMRTASFTHAENPHGDTVAFLPPATAGNKRINWLPMPRWDDNSWRPTLKVINYSNERVNLRYRKNKTIAIFRIQRDNKSRKKEIKAELEKRYGHYYDKIVLKYPPHERGLFGNHRGLSWQAVGDSVGMRLSEAVKFKLISGADSLNYVQKVAADSIRYFSRLSKLRKEYTYNISKLGWINCDRFLNDSRPKIQFTVDLGSGYEARNFQSSLVFARYQSVIPGYYSQSKLGYNEIPEGEPVHLICVGIKDGKVVACIRSFTASAGEINDLHFEETTPEQFKQKLRTLNLTSMN